MQPFQRDFLELALARDALDFGAFVLKSGRESPYFFNAARFDSGADLALLARCYRETLEAAGLRFDMLFGPAYKGIPLATALAVEFAQAGGRSLPLAFNRKESKAHGEGGHLIGAPIRGRVLIVDDVITAGTAIRESIDLIKAQGAVVAGVVVALDRDERGSGDLSAVQQVAADFVIPVLAIARLGDLVELAGTHRALKKHAPALRAYRVRYGAPPRASAQGPDEEIGRVEKFS